MKIPFNIKFRPQIESGEYKVETKDGRSVEIIKWDLRSPHGSAPILAIIHRDYDYNRTYSDEGYSTIDSDRLFIVTPEEELTEWQRFISACLQKHGLLDCGASDRIAKNCSTELLDLAREEIVKQGYVIEKKAFHDAVKKIDPEVMKEVSENVDAINEALRLEYEKGRTEALKDLPRWKKWGNGAAGNAEGHAIALVKGAGGLRFTSVLCATGEKYIMLDDLMKLPGFKE